MLRRQYQQPGSNGRQYGYRDWYIWADNDPGQTGPWGQDIWHPRGGDYYYGLFWSGMPGLNYTHPPVKEEMFNVANLGTSAIQPALSLPRSSLPPGEYLVSELLGEQPFGTITIDASGGFTGWPAGSRALPGRSTWILSLSLESPASSATVATPAGRVRLLPNPAQEQVQVLWEAPVRGAAQVQVFSSAGRLIFSGILEHGKLDLDRNGWPPGVYIVQVWDEEKRAVEKLIVVR